MPPLALWPAPQVLLIRGFFAYESAVLEGPAEGVRTGPQLRVPDSEL